MSDAKPETTRREWLVIENNRKHAVFIGDRDLRKPGYIPRDAAEQLLGRDLGGPTWFSNAESAAMRAHPDMDGERAVKESNRVPQTTIRMRRCGAVVLLLGMAIGSLPGGVGAQSGDIPIWMTCPTSRSCMRTLLLRDIGSASPGRICISFAPINGSSTLQNCFGLPGGMSGQDLLSGSEVIIAVSPQDLEAETNAKR